MATAEPIAAGRAATTTTSSLTRPNTARTVPARQTAPRFVGNPSALSASAMACSVAPDRRNSTARSTAAISSATGS